MTKFYPETSASPDFPKLEQEVLASWKAGGTFKKSMAGIARGQESEPAMSVRSTAPLQSKEAEQGALNEYVFYDGPPFANGLPHYGHLLTGFVKDIFARYHTMKGSKVERRFGWDCHGLPAEMAAEKELGVSGRANIEKFGIQKFNDHCRTSVMKYAKDWEQYVTRQARWVDFENDYKTMNRDYMESVMWAFKTLYDKGLIYESHRVMPYSWAMETPVSNFETRMDNAYREREDRAVYVAFKLNEKPKGAPEAKEYYLVAWTTTPWTLPSNLGLAVAKENNYTTILRNDVAYIIAGSAASSLEKSLPESVDKDVVIETARLYLRQFKETDIDLLHGIFSDKEVNEHLWVSQSKEQTQEILKDFSAHQKKHGFSKWAVFEKETNKFVGRSGLFFLDDTDDVEVGYILHKEFQGKGYATELAIACSEWYFNHTPAQKITAYAKPENKKSIEVMNKIGFTHERNFQSKKFGDERTLYSISRKDFFAKHGLKGGDLVGLKYKPLFPYFSHLALPNRETARCLLRPLAKADLEALVSLHTHPEVAKTTYDGMQSPQQVAEHLEGFIAHQQQHGYSQWAVHEKATGRFMGRAGLTLRALDETQPPRVELRLALLPEFWHQGYATELSQIWLDFAFHELGVDIVAATAHPENIRSHKMLKKQGFTHVKDLFFTNGGNGPYFTLPKMEYKPLQKMQYITRAGAFRVLDGSSFIEEGSGTGVVHLAPGFGEDDQRVCAENGIEIVCPVDSAGKYTDEIFDIVSPLLCSPLAGEHDALLRVGGGTREGTTLFAKEKAKELRKEMTDAEKKLWYCINDEKLGYKIRRQQSIGNYIANFYNSEKRLVIEVDGGGHADKAEHDAELTAYLNEQGIQVLRFWNNEVLQNIDGVVQRIIEALEKSPHAVSNETAAPPQGGSQVLSLKGLNVVADVRKNADEPYTDSQLSKYGLVNLRIIAWLKLHGQLIKQEDIKHNYPHCWRTDTPLIYRALPSWYVEVTKFNQRMVELNQQINWIPAHIKDGRFGKWLEGARDWSISRNRYWGSPIPVWKNEKGDVKVFGSIAELESFFGVKVEDLHRPFIDSLTKDGWTRVTDVFDCWFESGSMPFAQVHYPFENKDWFETHFPADFIVEYEAQTRGWFYTLMVLATALFDKPPFKNVICHGVVLDEKGQKLSKRLNNYADPLAMMEQYGADALRWRMVSSPIMQGGELLIAKDGSDVREISRLIIKPIWNAYHFFTLYANADNIRAEYLPPNSKHQTLDSYIVTKAMLSVAAIERAMDAYDVPSACKAGAEFFDALNNWYIRRSRDRFWKAEKDADKQAAYDTLYTVLSVMMRALAPLLPLTTEAIYRGLTNAESVHLTAFPYDAFVHAKDMHTDIVASMDKVREVCTAALSIRNNEQMRVRQPLASLTIVHKQADDMKPYADIIADELNVKTVNFVEGVEEFATHKIQPNFAVLGKRLKAEGKEEKMKQIIPAIKKNEYKFLGRGEIAICGETLRHYDDEYTALLEPKNKQGTMALSAQDGLVVLDLALTPALKTEGYARDIIRMVQQARKDAGLQITDHITLTFKGDAELEAAFTEWQKTIEEQTLSQGSIAEPANANYKTEEEIEGKKAAVGVKKA